MFSRMYAALSRRRASLMVLTPLLILIGIVHGVGMSSYPAFADDEGTYMAQAWAVQSQHTLSPYTYWYDHPPLGWLLLAVWSGIARVFEHTESAVIVGRQAMWVVSLVSSVLVFVLARRLGQRRPAAWIATAFFALSPLAIAYQRMVYLDNIAVMFVLAAFVLVCSPTRRLWAFAAAGGCLAAGVLSKETMILTAPALFWLAWRRAEPETRPFCMALLGSMFVFGTVTHPLFAVLKGELFPGTGHVSLVSALRFQLFTRPGTGSALNPQSASHAIVVGWLHLDPWLLVAGIVLLPIAFARPSLRPIALVLALEAVVVLRSGYLPSPQVLVLLPFAAILVTGVAQDVVDFLRRRIPAAPNGFQRMARRSASVVAAIPLIALPVVVAPNWFSSYQAAAAEHVTSPVLAAEQWIPSHIGKHARLLVDDVVWVDLVQEGFNPNLGVVWFYKLDFTNNPDPSVQRRLPAGWRDFDYVVDTPTMRSALSLLPGGLVQVRQANAHTYSVMTFGTGADKVDIRKIGNRPKSQPAEPVTTPKPPACPANASDLVRRLAALTGIPPNVAADIWAGCQPPADVLQHAQAARTNAVAPSRAAAQHLFPTLTQSPPPTTQPQPAPAPTPTPSRPTPPTTPTTTPPTTRPTPTTVPPITVPKTTVPPKPVPTPTTVHIATTPTT